MQIYGYVKADKGLFNFYTTFNGKDQRKSGQIYSFKDRKIFIYIDGAISKLSVDAIEISKSYESLEKKIAYLFSIGYEIESHIIGSFNIILFEFKLSKDFQIEKCSESTGIKLVLLCINFFLIIFHPQIIASLLAIAIFLVCFII